MFGWFQLVSKLGTTEDHPLPIFPPKPLTTKPLGHHYEYFYKTWPKSLFVSRCSSFIGIKNDPLSLGGQSFQTVLERKLPKLPERECSTYFSDDRKNAERFKQLD